MQQERVAADRPRSLSEHASHAGILIGFDDLVRELGGTPDLLLKDAGLERRIAEHSSTAIPVRALGQLLEAAAAQLGCPDFGLRLAERQPMSAIMHPLERLFHTAPTIRDALQGGSRHMGAFNSGLTMLFDESPQSGMHMLDFRLLDALALFPQLMEQLLLLTHKSVVFLSAGFAQSRRVWFTHLARGSPASYARRFNTVVEFGQEYDGLFFHEVDLRTKVVDCDAERFAYETRLMERRFPARHAEIDLCVRRAVTRVLTRAEDCTRQNVANHVGFQERTLNRRLSKYGTTFEVIRDEVRRDLAFRYLARADLPLTEIAGRLGYSELAVLSRCCRRWFGMSPRRLRQILLTGLWVDPGARMAGRMPLHA